jgi:hypothetical protein
VETRRFQGARLRRVSGLESPRSQDSAFGCVVACDGIGLVWNFAVWNLEFFWDLGCWNLGFYRV